MDVGLLEILRNSRCEDEKIYTHVSYYGPKAKWNIKSNELADFWKKYCDLVYDKNGNFCLGERPQDYMPVLSRLTLRFHDNNGEDPYGDDFVMSVVYCYQQAMMEILQISDDGFELICCVLEQDVQYVENNDLVYQIVLQFPYCRTDIPVQTKLIRPRVIQLLRMDNVVSRLSQQPINDWENILDPLVPQEPWPLYASKINSDYPPLVLNKIYKLIDIEHIESSKGPEIELQEIFFIQNHSYVQQGLIPITMFLEHDEINNIENFDRDFWLPMFLSINYSNKVTLPKPTVKNDKNKQSITSTSKSISTLTSLMTKDESPMDIVDRLLPMLSRDRIETEHYWIDVGKALYNCDQGGENGLNMWIHFTEKSDNHSADDCRALYPKFNLNNPLTIKTIAWYARQDSPEAYAAWHKSWCYPAMDKATSLSHTDVAIALYRVYWLDFVCASAGDRRWYYYNNHKWLFLDDGITLRQYISGDFRQRFEHLRTDISKQIQESTDENFKTSAEIIIKKIGELIKKLKNVSFKGNLVREAIEQFHDPNFDRYIDENGDLMGLINGVVETCDTYACVRDGKPEDYISKNAGIIWRYDFQWKHPLVERCMKWLSQVFTDKDLLCYSLKLSASCLKGRNSDKLFPILTGEGDNSKSMIKKLFECTFGSYCHTFPTTLFTSRRGNSSAPTPEVAQAKGARICFLQEPDSDDTFRNGILKELTGGDKFFARLLNDNGGNIEAMFKLFLMCNKVPMIPNSDKAVKNRVRIVPFLSTWVDNPPQSEDEQFKERLFKKDRFFEKQIPELAPAFMWILVQYYSRYIEEGLRQPEIVTAHTEEYWRDNDVYIQFTNECIEKAVLPDGKTIDMNAKLSLSEVYQEFRFWYRDSFPGLKAPDRSSVKHELSQRWGKLTRHGWVGVRTSIKSADVSDV